MSDLKVYEMKMSPLMLPVLSGFMSGGGDVVMEDDEGYGGVVLDMDVEEEIDRSAVVVTDMGNPYLWVYEKYTVRAEMEEEYYRGFMSLM